MHSKHAYLHAEGPVYYDWRLRKYVGDERWDYEVYDQQHYD